MSEEGPVLVVDDERHVRSALRRLLQRMGLETAEAGSAEEALEAIAASRFSCALVDLRMPGMGGMELVRRARASFPDLPIIVVTGHGDADDARRCTYIGVRHFVMKPWNNAELQIAVMRVLDEARQGGTRAEEPLRPEALRIATRTADALRMGPLPARFAPPAGVAWSDVWAGASGEALARLATSDPDLGRRFLALARVELGREVPLEAAAGLLGPERIALFLALAAVRRAHAPEPGRRPGQPVPATGVRSGDGAPPEPELERAFLHAWMRATAMKAAAQEIPGARADPRRAFLAGLFADLGSVVLVSELTVQGVLGGEALRIASEQHPSAGAWIAAEWRLPGECILAAAQHHAPTTLYRADPLLVLLWACEDVAVETSGARDPAPLPYGADAARLVGMSAGVRFEVERACRAAATRLGAALGLGVHATALRVA